MIAGVIFSLYYENQYSSYPYSHKAKMTFTVNRPFEDERVPLSDSFNRCPQFNVKAWKKADVKPYAYLDDS